jgi:carbon monoxide dehydrogenase subunit G
MPRIETSGRIEKPLSEVWDFIKEMDNWAPLLKGYVQHQKESDTDSVWTLSGDLGPFSKTVDMKVQITEWLDGERVAFTLEGVTELVSGNGALEISVERPPRSFWQRFWDWLLRRNVDTGPAEAGSVYLIFSFAIDVGGPMGPMVNPMLGPYANAVANELLTKVTHHLLSDPGGAE